MAHSVLQAFCRGEVANSGQIDQMPHTAGLVHGVEKVEGRHQFVDARQTEEDCVNGMFGQDRLNPLRTLDASLLDGNAAIIRS